MGNYRVKRVGADADPTFWTLGKIHGLENLAFVDPKRLAECEGNPVAIQKLVNEVNDVKRYGSHEEMLANMEKNMLEFRENVDKMSLQSSDRKKLLALPFYMSKRSELPEPKRGQLEWNLYREIYGEEYLNNLDEIDRDTEEKITEFNYEKFFPEGALDGVDTECAEFKTKIRKMNLQMKTKYEQHKQNQEEFRELMPYFRGLSADEMRAFVHKLQNDARKFGREYDDEIFDDMTSGRVEKELAKISEEQNYALKNRYRHQRNTMDFADKKRMPIDASKVRDLLRNQHVIRYKIESEISTLSQHEENPQVENGILTYLNEAAYGDMKALIRDVGITPDSIEFYNLARLREFDANRPFGSDRNLPWLVDGLYSPINMTDYEERFVGFNEFPKHVPIENISLLDVLRPESWP